MGVPVSIFVDVPDFVSLAAFLPGHRDVGTHAVRDQSTMSAQGDELCAKGHFSVDFYCKKAHLTKPLTHNLGYL